MRKVSLYSKKKHQVKLHISCQAGKKREHTSFLSHLLRCPFTTVNLLHWLRRSYQHTYGNQGRPSGDACSMPVTQRVQTCRALPHSSANWLRRVCYSLPGKRLRTKKSPDCSEADPSGNARTTSKVGRHKHVLLRDHPPFCLASQEPSTYLYLFSV